MSQRSSDETSYTRLVKTSRDLPGLYAYQEMYSLVGQARRRSMVVVLTEVHEDALHDKWIVWDVFMLQDKPHYWLLSITGDAIFSFCVDVIETQWPTCFQHRLDHIDDAWVTTVAEPHLIVKHVRKKEDLHYTNSKEHTGWERTNKRWGTISRSLYPNLVDELPFGKLYRALDVGAIIPVFRTAERLIGLRVKSNAIK